MNPFFDKLWYWRVAILKLVNGCVKVFILSWLSGTADRDWGDMSGPQQFTVILTGLLAMQAVVETFCDQTMSQLKAGSGGSNPTAFVRKE